MNVALIGRLNNGAILTGPEKVSLNLYQEISEYCPTVFIEYFQKNFKNSNYFTRFLGKYVKVDDKRIIRLGHLRLLHYLIKNQPDVIHILSAERFTIPIYLYKILLRGKIITTFHSVLRFEIPRDFSRRSKFNRYRDYLWEWLAIKYSDKLIFVSEQHFNLVKQYYQLDAKNIAIIPNGIEKEFYTINVKRKINNVINVIFYNGVKDTIDRGLTKIIENLKACKLKSIRLFVISGNNNSCVNTPFIEMVPPMGKEELLKFLINKHILIKSTSFDSFSIFTAECMAAGLIPIISDNVGLESYIENEKNGYVYQHLNPQEIREILSKIINQDYDFNKISINAKQIYLQLSWTKVVKHYLSVYKDEIKN